MMNVIQIQDRLKSFSEDQLAKEMESPSGSAPQYLVLSEFNRRKRVKADYEQQQNAQQQSSTVAEDVLAASGMPQAGLGALAQNMAPKTDMMQNSGAAPQQTMPMPEAPDAMAEIDPSEGGLAAMAGGGSVKRMAKGGRTKVEYDGRGYFVYADGDVQDAIGQPVSEYLAEAVKASMDESPDATTSTQSLSPTMADESPQAPTLESALSSDRPFNPLELSTPQTRDATPSDYGLGADIPDTLTEATAPAINQQQALIDAMSPAFDEFGGDPLAIAEERSNLSAPSASDVSPTVDLDLTTDQRISQEDMAMAVPVPQGQPRNFTQLLSDIENPVERGKAILAQSQGDQAQPYEGGQYTNADAIESFNERTRGKPMTPADKAEERLLFSNMNIPPDSPFAEYAGVDNPETSLVGYLGGKDYMDESEDFYNDISKNLLPPKTPDQIAREDLEKQKGLDAFLESQEMKGGRPGGSVPVDVLSQPVTDDTYRMPDVTDASGIFYGDDISPFDPSAIKRPREEFLAEVARQDPLDLPTRSTSLTPLQDIGGRGNVEFAASANPLPVTDSGANPFADAYEAFQDSIKQTKALRNAEKEPPLKQTLMEQEIAEVARQDPFDIPQSDDPSFPDGFTLGTAGGAASNALSFGNLSGLTADSKDGAGKAVFNPDRPTGDPTKPRGGAAPTGVESEILELLKKREEQFDSDKWLALARAGMAMMTSKSSNLLGAIGEGAATGLESLTQSRSAYNDAKLDLLTMRQKLEAARAKGTEPLGASSTNLTSIYNNLTDENTKLRKDIAAADAIDIGTGKPVGNSTLLKQALVKNEMDIDEVKRRLQFKGGVLQTEDVRDGPKTKNKTPSLSEIPELPYALGESVG